MAIFSEDLMRLGVNISSKTELLVSMVHMLHANKAIDSIERFKNAIFGREEIMSTGIGKGIALPHGRDICVSELKVAVCILGTPIDFDALDQEPVRIVFMIAVPQSAGKQYMRVLSSISHFTREEEHRNKMLSCQTEQELSNILKEIEDAIQQDMDSTAS
ncbi:MAG TPA: PTS sugar transporter subunit IIA [Candidatus Cloacimonadota bacterium]|nr:PTS sugar transporter subunit IIA [Candidatus Cloacimonadota bacterium]HPT70669.1 PTS sugar transporter subunit IIA [Candidatus Cloacimonadota bacterium]